MQHGYQPPMSEGFYGGGVSAAGGLQHQRLEILEKRVELLDRLVAAQHQTLEYAMRLLTGGMTASPDFSFGARSSAATPQGGVVYNQQAGPHGPQVPVTAATQGATRRAAT